MAKLRRKEVRETESAAIPGKAPRVVAVRSERVMTKRDWQVVGVVALVGFAAYINSIGGQFVYDDRFQILNNPTLSDLGNIPRMFTQSVWQFMNSSAQEPVGAYYRPLFNIALIINNHLFGTDPHGWHLVSVILHLAVTLGVYVLARRWKLSTEAAAAAALLFALHPLHVESVAWASGLPDPLAGVGLVGSLLLYEQYRAESERRAWLLAASVAAVLAAMCAKETAIAFPVFIGIRELLDGTPDESATARFVRSVRRALPFAAASLVYLGVRFAVLGFISKTEPKAVAVTSANVAFTIPSVLVHYLRTLLWPYPLAITYDVTYVDAASDPRFWASALAIVAALVGAVVLAGRSQVGQRGLAWLILFLAPVLNLKAFNPQESIVHDRYLYIPSIGFCLLAALALEWIASRFADKRERVFWAATGAICVVCFAFTVFQNETWSDDFAMAQQALAHDPNRPFLHNYVGATYFRQNRLADAETWYKQAIALEPNSFDALTNLADVCKLQNRLPEAEKYYAQAAEAGSPYFNTYYNLASIYMNSNRLDEALPRLERAFQIDPANADGPYSLGWVYDQKGDAARAEQFYVEALRLRPTYPEPRINLAVLQTKQARYKEALDNLLYVRKLVPQHPILLYALGDVYMKTGRAQDAVTIFSQLAQAQPQHRLVHTSLGLCYETLGDVAKARDAFARAVQVAPQEPYTNTAREHLARLGA